MNPLLLFGGLSVARKGIGDAMHRTILGVVAYAMLVCSGLVALGFFTAGCFLYITANWGEVTASLIVAAVYAVAGSIGFLAIRMVQRRQRYRVVQPISTRAHVIADAAASPDIPGGIASVGLLVAAGYAIGRSMARHR